MYRLNIKKLGFAFGLTGALIYLGCMIVMAKEQSSFLIASYTV